jgi:hypothetical protein
MIKSLKAQDTSRYLAHWLCHDKIVENIASKYIQKRTSLAKGRFTGPTHTLHNGHAPGGYSKEN